jgi:dipeptidyl aminopeptidase/acylaminoacyl peptidase
MHLVYTGNEGALFAWRPGDASATRITWGWEEIDPRGGRTSLRYGWPACSPRGDRVLALAQRDEQRHFAYVIDANGVETAEVAALGDATPIYGNWAPDGRRVAILVQRKDTLALELFAVPAEPKGRRVARGAPLFWSWSPDGRTIAVHAGQSTEDVSTGGTWLVDVASGETSHLLSAVPALYHAPSWSPDGTLVAFARTGGRGARLVLADPATGERQSRSVESGAVTFVWHPALAQIAYAVASDASPHVYERVVVLDIVADREWTIERPTLAFFWHPQQPELFRLAVDRRREELFWEATAGPADSRLLARFSPTREVVFAASFFDQYALSHTPVAPDGSAIAIAGRMLADAPGGAPRIYVVPTDSGPVQVVGDGLYAAWGR